MKRRSINRRQALQLMASGAAGTAGTVFLASCAAPDDPGGGATAGGGDDAPVVQAFDLPAKQVYPFELPALPYDHDALQAAIDTETMQIHHGKHHQGYTNKLNAALEGQADLHDKTIVDLLSKLNELPESIRSGVRNAGGGYLNHALFWPAMSPNGGGAPSGALAGKIDEAFGSYDGFKQQFGAAAKSVFGSGWAWLVSDRQGALSIRSTANQDTPFSNGMIPLLGLDVWEHAYYLRYQNKRGDYIANFFNVIDWGFVGGQYGA